MDEMKGRILRPHENIIGLDLPPEFCEYRDEGCELANSCLHCPFPICIPEETRGETKWLKQERSREMARLYSSKEKSVKELAAMFGVSSRTTYRELQTRRNSKSSSKSRRKLKKFVSRMKTGRNRGGKRK